jgi:hypothetical protein
VKNIGLYPRVRVDTSGTGVVSHAGGVALVETVRAAGLDRALSVALSRWRKPMAIHDPGKVITDLAVALALGGDCLADVGLLRAEPGVFGLVASDPDGVAHDRRLGCRLEAGAGSDRQRPRRSAGPGLGVGR